MKPQKSQRNLLCSLEKIPLKEVTERIISCVLEVHSTRGLGLLQSVYEEADNLEDTEGGVIAVFLNS
jgi:hypothetical protein